VSSVGGDISVQSELGKGSTFRVLLPVAVESDAPEPAPAPASPVVERSRRGRILVVDDEAMICAAVRRMLGAEHDVTTATSAREALDRVAAGEPFDVILCDLMMPQLTGMDFHAELSRAAPHLVERLVFMTGGAFTPPARAFLDRIPNARVEKPFDAGNLRFIVQSLLR